LLANPVCQARRVLAVTTPSRASALLQVIFGIHMIVVDAKFVGAGLLANPVCQARRVLAVTTPSRASALLQAIFGVHMICGGRQIRRSRLAGEPCFTTPLQR
jgi:hypothetical protein